MQHIHPKHDVLGGHAFTIGPLVVLQLHNNGGVVVGVGGVRRKREGRVEIWGGAISEPVERPVHQELELVDVRNAKELKTHERKDVVRWRLRSLCPSGDRTARRTSARGERWCHSDDAHRQRTCGNSRDDETSK